MIDFAYKDLMAQGKSTIYGPSNTEVTISAFTLSNSEPSVSTLVGSAPLGNVDNVTIALPFLQMGKNRDTSYKITVRWQNEDDDTLRYVLFDGNDAFSLLYEDYSGQTIAPEAVIEVWANPANVTIMSTDDIVFFLNACTRRTTDGSVDTCSDVPQTEVTLTITAT